MVVLTTPLNSICVFWTLLKIHRLFYEKSNRKLCPHDFFGVTQDLLLAKREPRSLKKKSSIQRSVEMSHFIILKHKSNKIDLRHYIWNVLMIGITYKDT